MYLNSDHHYFYYNRINKLVVMKEILKWGYNVFIFHILNGLIHTRTLLSLKMNEILMSFKHLTACFRIYWFF